MPLGFIAVGFEFRALFFGGRLGRRLALEALLFIECFFRGAISSEEGGGAVSIMQHVGGDTFADVSDPVAHACGLAALFARIAVVHAAYDLERGTAGAPALVWFRCSGRVELS